MMMTVLKRIIEISARNSDLSSRTAAVWGGWSCSGWRVSCWDAQQCVHTPSTAFTEVTWYQRVWRRNRKSWAKHSPNLFFHGFWESVIHFLNISEFTYATFILKRFLHRIKCSYYLTDIIETGILRDWTRLWQKRSPIRKQVVLLIEYLRWFNRTDSQV